MLLQNTHISPELRENIHVYRVLSVNISFNNIKLFSGPTWFSTEDHDVTLKISAVVMSL